MIGLMTFQEMAKRYEAGEDSFELTIEKWTRIKESLNSAFNLFHFQEILKGASIQVALCLEYQNQCFRCPLEKICSSEKEGIFFTVIRVIQAYVIAGDVLPKDPLWGLVDKLIRELKKCQEEVRKRVH